MFVITLPVAVRPGIDDNRNARPESRAESRPDGTRPIEKTIRQNRN